MTEHEQDNHAGHTLDHWVHWTLLAGVALSGTLLAAGLLLGLARPGSSAHGDQAKPWTLLGDPRHADPAVVVLDLGLLCLVATPVLRVIVLGAGWTITGPRRFGLVALIVLGLLLVSVFLGHA